MDSDSPADAAYDPLLARFPGLGLEPLPLVARPTPVEAAPWLGDDVWIKRDDQTGRSGHGGSKLRKLAYLLAEHDGRPLVVIGPTGSNWVLSAAHVCRELGLELRVHRFLAHPYPGAARKDRWVDERAVVGPTRSVAGCLAAAVADGISGSRILPMGGSDALGALAYASAALELAEQVAAGELPEPSAVYVPYGSGGTAVGLALGLAWSGMRTVVRAVRVNERSVANPLAAQALARAALSRVAAEGDLGRLTWRHDQYGGCYGRPTPRSRAAVARAAMAGLKLEPVYTGKALAALAADRSAGDTEPVVLWNTYGPLG